MGKGKVPYCNYVVMTQLEKSHISQTKVVLTSRIFVPPKARLPAHIKERAIVLEGTIVIPLKGGRRRGDGG